MAGLVGFAVVVAAADAAVAAADVAVAVAAAAVAATPFVLFTSAVCFSCLLMILF